MKAVGFLFSVGICIMEFVKILKKLERKEIKMSDFVDDFIIIVFAIIIELSSILTT